MYKEMGEEGVWARSVTRHRQQAITLPAGLQPQPNRAQAPGPPLLLLLLHLGEELDRVLQRADEGIHLLLRVVQVCARPRARGDAQVPAPEVCAWMEREEEGEEWASVECGGAHIGAPPYTEC